MKLTGADWTGETSSRAMSAHDKLVREGDRHAAGTAAIVKGLGQAADAIPPLHRQIHEAEELARRYEFTVGANGELTDHYEGQQPPKDLHPEDRARAKKEIVAKLKQVARTGTDIDRDLAEVFGKAGNGDYGVGQEGKLSTAAAAGSHTNPVTGPDPPKHGTPTQNAAWWATLSGHEKQAMIQHAPGKIGNLNGLPAQVRSEANMSRIKGMRKKLQHERAGLRKLNKIDFVDCSEELDTVEAKLKSLNKIDATMNKDDGHHRQLMLLDDSQKRMQAAVGVGDVDKAKHVGVFTPGMNSTVDNSLGDYDDDMSHLKRASDRMSRVHGDGGKTAAVTWMGYQAPQGDEMLDPFHSAALPLDAYGAGNQLNDFNKGIDSSREHTDAGIPHQTAIGHSYGSAATGSMLGHKDTPTDDAMLVGSPGMVTDDPKIPESHIYSEWAKDDYIPLTNLGGTLGPNTYDHSDNLSTDAAMTPDGPRKEATGHGVSQGYLADKTTSQYNTAAVVTGHKELTVH